MTNFPRATKAAVLYMLTEEVGMYDKLTKNLRLKKTWRPSEIATTSAKYRQRQGMLRDLIRLVETYWDTQ